MNEETKALLKEMRELRHRVIDEMMDVEVTQDESQRHIPSVVH